MLTGDQRERYERDGFLVVEGFVDRDTCRHLVERARAIIDAFDPATSRSIFTTHEQTRTTDAWFLGSAGDIRCFFEEEAFDEHGDLVAPKTEVINKIGHALHDLDPEYAPFSRHPALAEVAEDLGLRDVLLLQSMVIVKPPHIGGEVSCHQDATFLYTDPITVTGFWFALEDATIENGCLWAEPGGHRGPLRRRFERSDPNLPDDRVTMRFVELDPTPLPAPPEGLVPLEVPAGTLVVLHGLLPHWSDANRSARSRYAYSIHVIEGWATYPATNWLRRGEDLPLRGFDAARA